MTRHGLLPFAIISVILLLLCTVMLALFPASNAAVISGLIVVAAIALTLVALVLRLVLGIFVAAREHRAAEARRVVRMLPGLGEFETFGNGMWAGEVNGLAVGLYCDSDLPDETLVARVRSLLDSLPVLTEQGRQYLVAQPDTASLSGRPSAFELYGLSWWDNETFELEYIHAQDPDGLYRVGYKSGRPNYVARDD